ncbi:MAG TPA: YggS family pyridoxal phosphate-dependent enzyme [Chthonomonadaceae bacterium]|nr:YggS family pyridoxal phosphate-dependent enzyme [Chthonomonadaceae bacterium]
MAEAKIARNIARVRERIAQAAARSGRPAEAVTLVAVTKTVEAARIAQAYAAGVRDFGENYLQEAFAKLGQPPLDAPDIRWHFIGHLQSNKVKDVIGRFTLLQSIDSVPLAKEVGKRAQKAGIVQDILLEVKLDVSSGTKYGFAPEAVLEAAAQIGALPGLRLCGLMGMAPFSANPEQARPYFQHLRRLYVQLPPAAQRYLSMGMSGDFEVAVEEGANLVRIGTAIFGRRA